MQFLLTGSIAIDRIMIFPGKFADVIQPDKLHVLSVSVLVNKLQDTRGGVAANIAYTLGLLGENPILYGSIGKSAKSYMEDLTQMGIDTSCVHYSQLPTATFTVMTDQANCQVGGFYPGAMSDAESLTITPFAKKNIFVVISPHDPTQMAKQVAECKKLKKRLFYDVGQQANNIDGQDIRAGIETAELLIVNDYEMGVLVKKSGWSEKEICKKVKVCVITLGEEGSVVFASGKKQTIPALTIENIADPTGAGDAFRAGFLYGYIRNYTPAVCAQIGSTTAAYAIEKPGTQEHFFTMDELKKRYEAGYGESFDKLTK